MCYRVCLTVSFIFIMTIKHRNYNSQGTILNYRFPWNRKFQNFSLRHDVYVFCAKHLKRKILRAFLYFLTLHELQNITWINRSFEVVPVWLKANSDKLIFSYSSGYLGLNVNKVVNKPREVCQRWSVETILAKSSYGSGMFTSYQEKMCVCANFLSRLFTCYLKEMRERQVKGENYSEAISSTDSVNGIWVFYGKKNPIFFSLVILASAKHPPLTLNTPHRVTWFDCTSTVCREKLVLTANCACVSAKECKINNWGE